jgi:hypothetical protein
MPHFSLNFSAGGPLIRAVVSVSEARSKALTAAGSAIPPDQIITALVDTGASSTCIDPSVLDQLGLSPTGSCEVKTPSTGDGAATVSQYDVALLVYGRDTNSPPLVFPVMPVLATPLATQGIQGLIGRDLLSQCVLVYNGTDGVFTLAY